MAEEQLIITPDLMLVVLGKVYDLRKVIKAESRVHELRALTNFKAGELLHCFIEGVADAKKVAGSLRAQLLTTKENVKRVVGYITLDKAPDLLKDKGLATTRSPGGSADLREAVVHTDKQYFKAVEEVAVVQAAVEHVDAAVDKLKMAYFSVHALMDPHDISQKSINTGDARDPFAPTDRERAQRFVDENAGSDPKDYQDSGFGSVDL